MRASLLLLVLFAVGCDPTTDKDDTGDTDDSGKTPSTGCVTVDGGTGYGTIAEAVAYASDGSTIVVCAGTWEEAVVVNKAVTIVGDGEVIVSAPSNEVPFTVEASGVTLQDMQIESTRSGVVITGVADTTLSGLTFGETGSWGVSASAATNTTIVDSSFGASAAGGVEVSGGSASVEGASFDGTVSYGVLATDDAAVSVSGSMFSGITAAASDGSDGAAVAAFGAYVSVSDVTIDAVDIYGIFGDEGELDVDGAYITGTPYGVFSLNGPFTGANLTILEAQGEGVIAYAPAAAVYLSDSVITTTVSCDYEYADFNDSLMCGGALLMGTDIVASNVSIAGYADYGLIAWGQADDTPLALSGITLEGVGQRGLWLDRVVGTATDVTVTGLVEPELTAPCTDGTYIYLDMATAVLVGGASDYSASVAFDGLTLADNDGWGLSNFSQEVSLAGMDLDGNACAGVINYQGVATVTGATVTNGNADYASIYNYQGAMTIDSSSFSGTHATYSYTYDDGTTEYEWVYSGYGLDIQSYDAASMEITNNTFTDGDQSISIYTGPALIQGNTWTDYEENLITASLAGESDPVEVLDNVVDDVGGTVVYAAESNVEVDGLTVGTTRTSTTSYTEYQDGVETYSYTYESYSQLVYAYGYYYDDGAGTVYEYPCDLSLSDVTVTDAVYNVLYASDATVDVEGLTIESTGGSALTYYASTYPADIEVQDLYVGAASGSGITLYDTSGMAGTATFTGVQVDEAGSYGLYQTGLTSLDVSESTFASTGSGIASESMWQEYDYTDYVYVINDAATALTLTNVTVTDAGADGVSVFGGSFAATGLTVSGASSTGVSLQATTLATLSASTVEDAAVGVSSTSTYTYDGYSEDLAMDGATQLTLSGVTVARAGADGIVVAGGTASLSGVSSTANTGDGLSLSGSVTADVQGNTLTGNQEYGMVCESVTLSACSANDLAGNQLGQHSGCDDACGL